MFTLSVSWWELIVRAIVVYAALILMLRVTGKRQVGQLAPFDLVLLLVLSNAVQNSINGGDNSLVGGLILAFTLILLNYVVSYLTRRSRTFETLVDGSPQILIHNGRLYEQALKSSFITHHELNAALRRGGCLAIEDVHLALLETNGGISVIPKEKKEPSKV